MCLSFSFISHCVAKWCSQSARQNSNFPGCLTKQKSSCHCITRQQKVCLVAAPVNAASSKSWIIYKNSLYLTNAAPQ